MIVGLKKKGIIGSMLTITILAIIFIVFYRVNNGDIVGGISNIAAKVADFISAMADKLMSVQWFRSLFH